MGKIAKGVKCSVVGCDEQAVKSISVQKLPPSLKVDVTRGRAYLCRRHYKEYKKLTKEERRIEKWRYAQI
ncbi:MAG: hypothetical protein J7J19_05695 [Thaumarchaeota archaeon]|nr:hypothetical protein [Nitrososphaerota archaeon]